MSQPVQLALGTVQFGLAYGIAGRSAPVPADEVREIFTRASKHGISLLDTAPAYGDIEALLSKLTQGLCFEVVSKIPPLPQGIEDAESIRRFVDASIRRSRERLGDQLKALLFHDATDLCGKFGHAIWELACSAIENTGIKLGVSCYSPQEAESVLRKFAIDVVQLPGNAFDQRLLKARVSEKIEVHVRSVFLQGLLLLNQEQVALRLPRATDAMRAWWAWCAEHGMSPLRAALGIAKSFSGVRCCVVGVDGVAQFDQILEAWEATPPLKAPTLALEDERVLEPRLWHVDESRLAGS